MPEALVVLAVLAVALAAWIGAWLHARDPAHHDAAQEMARLRHHAAWLEQRLEVARRERWDAAMIGTLTEELGVTAQQLARAGGSAAIEQAAPR